MGRSGLIGGLSYTPTPYVASSQQSTNIQWTRTGSMLAQARNRLSDPLNNSYLDCITNSYPRDYSAPRVEGEETPLTVIGQLQCDTDNWLADIK